MHFADSGLAQELEEPAARIPDARYWHKADIPRRWTISDQLKADSLAIILMGREDIGRFEIF